MELKISPKFLCLGRGCMGVSNLWTVIRPSLRRIGFSSLGSLCLAIDVNIWLMSFIRVFGDKNQDTIQHFYLRGLWGRLCKLLSMNIRPIFIFDGVPPSLKARTIFRRKLSTYRQETKFRKLARQLLLNQLKLNSLKNIKSLIKSGNLDISDAIKTLKNMNSVKIDDIKLSNNENTVSECNGSNIGEKDPSSEEKLENCGRTIEELFMEKYNLKKEELRALDPNDNLLKSKSNNAKLELLLDMYRSHLGSVGDIVTSTNKRISSNDYSMLQMKQLLCRGSITRHLDEIRKETEEEGVKNLISDPKTKYKLVNTLGISSVPCGEPNVFTVKMNRNLRSSSRDSLSPKKCDKSELEGPVYLYTNSSTSDSPASSLISDNILLDLDLPKDSSDIPSNENIQADSTRDANEELAEDGNAHLNRDIANPLKDDGDISTLSNDNFGMNLFKRDEFSDEYDDEYCSVDSMAYSDSNSESMDMVLHTAETKSNVDESDLNFDHTSSIGDNKKRFKYAQQPVVTSLQIPENDGMEKDDSLENVEFHDVNCEDYEVIPQSPKESKNADVDESYFLELEHDLKSQYSKLKSIRDSSKRNASVLNDQIIANAKELLSLFGIPFIDSPGEADAQCAHLETLGLTDGTISDDNDVLVFGGKNVFRHVFSSRYPLELHSIDKIKDELSLTREDLIFLALLLGSDYGDGIKGIGPVAAYDIVINFKSPYHFESWTSEFQYFLSKCEDSPLKKCNLSSYRSSVHENPSSSFIKKYENLLKKLKLDSFPSNEIIDTYSNPEVVSTSRRELKWKAPDLEKLKFFAWTKMKWKQERVESTIRPLLQKLEKNILIPNGCE